MSKPHKWAKEIKAWADGAEIEYASYDKEDWELCHANDPSWGNVFRYRIKPQPKEPQYLYVFKYAGHIHIRDTPTQDCGETYIGKIKLEQDDE